MLPALFCGAALAGCERPDDATRAVRDAIRVHGGERFEQSALTFTFRGTPFLLERDDGRFRYERRYEDALGRQVVEGITNDGVYMAVDGSPVTLTQRERDRIDTAVNSVVYFGFLPFRLDDEAVRLRYLGETTVEGEPYRKIEATFEEEGGGQDWEDRFVYWFHADRSTLDYMAYRYHRDGGGTRFRRGINRRTVDGILVQDYENMRADVRDIADYDRLFEEGSLERVSVVALEDLEPVPPGSLP